MGADVLKMRDLEAATGVGREAIRFYIREGLLPEPRRPHRNVAHYGEEHVLCIRAIKRLQEERHLPLSRIREVLDAGDVEALATGRGEELATLIGELLGESGSPPRAVAQVAAAAGVPESEVRALAARGVVHPRDDDTLDAADARLVELWGRALALGFTPERGFDHDQLVATQAHAEAIAELQIGRFMEDLGRRGSGRDAAELGAEGLLLARDLLGAMHLRAALRFLRESGPDED